MEPAISDYNMVLILLSVIQLRGGHTSVAFKIINPCYISIKITKEM